MEETGTQTTWDDVVIKSYGNADFPVLDSMAQVDSKLESTNVNGLDTMAQHDSKVESAAMPAVESESAIETKTPIVEVDKVPEMQSEVSNMKDSSKPTTTGISLRIEKINQEPSTSTKQNSSKVGYILVLTLAVSIAFSLIQPRFFKIILSLAIEDDSFVAAI